MVTYAAESFEGASVGTTLTISNTSSDLITGSPTFQSGGIYGQCMDCNTTSTTASARFPLTSLRTFVSNLFWYKPVSMPSVATIIEISRAGATVRADLRQNTNGTLSIRNATTAVFTSTTVLSAGTGYWLEHTIDQAGAQQFLRIYDAAGNLLENSGVQTYNQSTIDTVVLGVTTSGTSHLLFDELAVTSTQTGAPKAATAAASIVITGSATGTAGGTAATAAAAITITGAVAAKAAVTAAGALTITGAVTAAAPVTASGSVVITGATVAKAPAVASGSVVITGATTARAPAAATGAITITGNALTAILYKGSVIITGSVSGKAPVVASGGVSINGAVGTVKAAAIIQGQITVTGYVGTVTHGAVPVFAMLVKVYATVIVKVPDPVSGVLTKTYNNGDTVTPWAPADYKFVPALVASGNAFYQSTRVL